MLRMARGLTQQEVADKATAAGHRMERFAVANVERGSSPRGAGVNSLRAVTVDELVAIAAALAVEPSQLLVEPQCETCNGAPPPGFACIECGTAAKRSNGDHQ
jgi:transcriptional regulator with XRE-family HTH domain